jgi:hypothetical protein
MLKSRAHTYECLDCGRQTSITAGTVLHRSKLPMSMWFWAAHLMATHSNGMSALQLAAQLGVTYKTAWLLTQKLRRSMVDPDRTLLEGVVEVDQTEIPFRTEDARAALLGAQDRSRYDLQARASRREKLASSARPQPLAESHPRCKVQRRNRGSQIASSSRCRLTPVVTKIQR